MSGILYVVATPIGNLDDLTPRARQTLAEVSLVAAEDTRHTGRLLLHIGCKTRLLALHDYNEERVTASLIERLREGESIALVSDAGTPLVSDPGYRLVRTAHEQHIAVSPIPGPSAVTAALSVAGIATDRFCFEGFLPAKQVARRQRLEALAGEPRTLVIYESVHRIDECLADMIAALGAERQAFVGRELTKLHEQCMQGSLAALKSALDSGAIVAKGEFVVVIAGAGDTETGDTDVDRLLLALVDHLPPKKVAGIVAGLTGETKNDLYDRLLAIRARR